MTAALKVRLCPVFTMLPCAVLTFLRVVLMRTLAVVKRLYAVVMRLHAVVTCRGDTSRHFEYAICYCGDKAEISTFEP